MPIDPRKSARPIGATMSWSQATRLDNALKLTLLVLAFKERRGKRDSKKEFQRPINGLMVNPKQKKRRVRKKS